MGCGKTTVGTLLARQLAWRFDDLDARIEERAGLSIPAMFERQGEPAFRQMEREQLEAALGRVNESSEPLVLALGGGTYAQPGVIEWLRASGAAVIWLELAEHVPREPGAVDDLRRALDRFVRLEAVPWIVRGRTALAIGGQAGAG